MYTFEKNIFTQKFFSHAEYLPKYALFLNMNSSLHCLLLSEVSTDSGRLIPQDFGGEKFSCAFLRQNDENRGFVKLILLHKSLLR